MGQASLSHLAPLSFLPNTTRQIDQFGDNPWETPLGKVIEGIENVLQWYSYGHDGVNPKQGRIE
jgi:hypothetical protein